MKLIFGSLFLLLVSCQSRDFNTASSVTKKEGVANVGIVLDLSGEYSSAGKAAQQGVQLAIEELKTYGKAAGLNFVLKDSASTPKTAAMVTNSLIVSDKVSLVINAMDNHFSQVCNLVSSASKTLMFYTMAPANINCTNFKYSYNFIHEETDAYTMAKYASENLKAKSAVTIFDADSDDERRDRKHFVSHFQKMGGKIVIEWAIVSKDFENDLGAEKEFLQKLIAEAQPDVVYTSTNYSITDILLSHASSLKIKTKFLGSSHWRQKDQQKKQFVEKSQFKLTPGNFFTLPFTPDSNNETSKSFVQKFVKKYNVNPTPEAALAYDSVKFVAQAIAQAKTNGTEDINNAVRSLKTFEGALGKRTFDGAGAIVQKGMVVQTTSSGYALVP